MSKETTSNKTKKRVASFFGRIVVYILVLVLIAGIPFAYKFGHSVFYASSVDSPPGRNIQVNVVEGMSFHLKYRQDFLISECIQVNIPLIPHKHPERYWK